MMTEGDPASRETVYVEKIRVPARVSQPSLGPRDGWFLLFPRMGSARRPETLIELLDSSRVVVPFIQAEDSTVLLLTRPNIDWVIVGRGVERRLIYPPEYRITTEQRVDLRLIDESHVHAVVRWDSHEGTVRLSDHLNSSSGFIVATTGFGLLLVNKLRVRETRLAESTARPVDVPDTANPGAAA